MCNNNEVVLILGVIKSVYDILKFIIPIYLIVSITIDVFKIIIAKSSDDEKKIRKLILNRVVSSIILFLIPTFVFFTFGTLFGETTTSVNDARSCWNLS